VLCLLDLLARSWDDFGIIRMIMAWYWDDYVMFFMMIMVCFWDDYVWHVVGMIETSELKCFINPAEIYRTLRVHQPRKDATRE